ncbi:hypothetical protein ACFC34_42165 [Streptomyces sp. NPDC056053]|uniref:hypothetical protein n=1 Tax=Streptomyces sp. NPDC056053 TaxID=3345696 RepID=UPI0035E3775E
MTAAETTPTLLEGAYEGFRLRFGDVLVDVRPVAGESLAALAPEIQIDIYMADVDGIGRCALTERVQGTQQLRTALSEWKAILS